MYAVAARFNLEYPMNYELLRENLPKLDSISFVSLGECVSDISKNIINLTFLKSKEIDLQKEVATGKRLRYNNIKEKSEEAKENDVLRGAAGGSNKKSAAERVQRTGEYGRNSGENQGEYAKQLGGRNELYEGISEPDLRIHEVGLSFRERGRSNVLGDDFSLKRSDNQGSSRSVEEMQKEARKASLLYLQIMIMLFKTG